MHPLVSAPWLLQNLNLAHLRIVDCRFSLNDALAGYMAYSQGHIPGAVYANLETDLSGPVLPNRQGGRHPLPSPANAATAMEQLGISNHNLVVAYDDTGMVAPRLWWLLRWLGHTQVAVLDGGITAFVQAGGALESGVNQASLGHFVPNPGQMPTVSAQEVLGRAAQTLLIDSRAPERYAGLQEPIDPVAGHIPGAINHNWAEALNPDGQFKTPEQQAQRFGELPQEVLVYCGSGVSAAANILALELMGKTAKLYAGSWSDWVSDPTRPIAKK